MPGCCRRVSPRGDVDRTRASRSSASIGRSSRSGSTSSSTRSATAPTAFSTACSICAAATRSLPAISRPSRVEIGETQATILRNHRPQNALDAKFSAEFAVAAAAVAGECGLAELTDAFVRRSDVQDVFPKVRISTRTDRLPEEPALAAHDRVAVVLRDGRKLRIRADRLSARPLQAPGRCDAGCGASSRTAPPTSMDEARGAIAVRSAAGARPARLRDRISPAPWLRAAREGRLTCRLPCFR